jgi:hypothetical protein
MWCSSPIWTWDSLDFARHEALACGIPDEAEDASVVSAVAPEAMT